MLLAIHQINQTEAILALTPRFIYALQGCRTNCHIAFNSWAKLGVTGQANMCEHLADYVRSPIGQSVLCSLAGYARGTQCSMRIRQVWPYQR